MAANRRSISVVDLVRFGRAGIDAADAEKWVVEGISPFEAELLVTASLGPDDGRRILDAGVSALAYVVVAQREQLDPAEVDAVLGRIDDARREGVTPQCWVPRVEPQVAQRWWDHALITAMESPLAIDAQLGDIAEMLGATASKLSTMRRSHPGFPAPLTASRSPRFALAAVIDSAVFASEAASISPSLLARMVVRTLVESAATEPGIASSGDARWNRLRREVVELVATVGAIELQPAARRRVERAIADDEAIAVLPTDPPPGVDAALWRTLSQAVVAWMLGVGSRRSVHAGEVLEMLLMVIDEVAPPVTVATGPALGRLIVDVADLRPGQRILDPGCGVGELLVAAAVRAGHSGTYHGIEIDPDLAEVARLRLQARALRHEVRCADWFDERTSNLARYDTVLVDPPLTGGVDDWVDRAMEILAPGGRVVIVTRQSDLRASGSIHQHLADGRVEAEIQIPHRARAEGRMPKYVVVLTREARDDRLPIREDLSAARITTSGGRVRTGTTSEQGSDRLRLDTGRLLSALAQRRHPSKPPQDHGVLSRAGRDWRGSGGDPELSLAYGLMSALRQRLKNEGSDQDAARALLDALERFVGDDS